MHIKGLPNFIIIIIILIILLTVAYHKTYGEPSYPFWFHSDELPGYFTDCKDYCWHYLTVDPYITQYTIWADKGVITGASFDLKHVNVGDLTLIFGDPSIYIGEQIYWYNSEYYSPVPVEIMATLDEDGLVTQVNFYRGEDNE